MYYLLTVALRSPYQESQMNNATPANRWPKSKMDPDLLKVVQQFGFKNVLENLRTYCNMQADDAVSEGCTGMGWLELHDAIDEIIPADVDALFGDEAPEFVTCRSCLTGGDHCTC